MVDTYIFRNTLVGWAAGAVGDVDSEAQGAGDWSGTLVYTAFT